MTGWMVAASFLVGIWIGARESALRASTSTRSEGLRASWGASSYGTFDEVEASLQRWAETHEEHVRLHRLASSRERRPLLALEVSPDSVEPIGAATRPWTILLVGGLDGRSVAGVHAVMLAAERAITSLPTLRRDVRFLFVPAAAPDALAHAAARPDGSGRGRNLRPLDDDRDGRIDEDGPDDIDGDGLVLDMLIEDPLGPWAFTGTPRMLVRAEEGMAPRYRLVPEGRDDDGDGLFNEDGVGGVDYSTHFPVGWTPPRAGGVGVRPLAEPVPRALAEFAVEERVDVAFFFEGNHGGLAFPGETDDAADGFERALQAHFERSTGRTTSGALVQRTAAPGHMLTWLHAALGVRAVQVAAWGPEVVGVDGRPFARAAGIGTSDPTRAWRRWVDEVRGGEGFVDWHPADLGRGRVALVGGFEPRTRTDPPEELLGAALRGLDGFVAEVANALPRLDIEVVEVERHGDCVDLRARVVNRGGFPLDFRGAPVDAELVLHAAGEIELLAGAARVPLRALNAFEASGTEAWYVRLPAGATLTLTATYDGDRSVTRQLRP